MGGLGPNWAYLAAAAAIWAAVAYGLFGAPPPPGEVQPGATVLAVAQVQAACPK